MQAVAVCAAEAKVGGVYIAVVTEPAAALPEIADVEEETELGDEAPIAPPGACHPLLPRLSPPFLLCTLAVLHQIVLVAAAIAVRACLLQEVHE